MPPLRGDVWRSNVKGVLAAVAIAAVATLATGALERVGGGFVSTVFVAIVLGITVRLTVGLPDTWQPGVNLAAKRVLRLAIVLLGFRFSIGSVLETGWSAIMVIVAVIITGFVVTSALTQWLDIDRRLGLLIGVGTAICGLSAIAATAPVVEANDEEISFASTVITLFGTLAMLSYPFIGRAIGLDAEQFGFLAGAGIHDSAQAVASGFIHSELAGHVATVVKLTRTGFLVPVVVITGLMVRKGSDSSQPGTRVKALPLFALGFIVASLVRTTGDAIVGGSAAWPNLLGFVGETSSFLLVVAMAAVGLNTRIAGLKRIGLKPLSIGMAAAVLAGCAALSVTLLIN